MGGLLQAIYTRDICLEYIGSTQENMLQVHVSVSQEPVCLMGEKDVRLEMILGTIKRQN